MTIRELLACATSEAKQYIKKSVNSKNKADYQKLKKLFDSKLFEAKSFDDTELDILKFDWQSLERDRNWWWQLQAHPFLNWFVNSFELQNEEEKSRYFSLCLDAIQCWVNSAKQNSHSPLVWHDHAAAFRVRNLANWLLFCHIYGLPISENECAESLAGLVVEHLEWMQVDKHFSKHTNHGFDQAMIALTIGLMFAHEGFESHRQLNRQRLKEEVVFAFTDEGVHKENSPGYQKMMLGRLKQLRALATLGDVEISKLGERYIENAEAFLRAITLPNGYLPMIGDTRGEDEGLAYVQQKEVDVLDYSASGYVVVRGVDGQSKDFFILLKNTHESNYHRHDDDMMIYIYFDGEVVLGDGGLYKHQEADEKRKHLRSYLSHSVPYISARAIRNKQDLPGDPVTIREGDFVFQMASMMFGKWLARKVEITWSPSLTITILDQAIDEIDGSVWTNFFLENEYPVSVGDIGFQVKFPRFGFNVGYPNTSPIILNKGWACSENERGACVSRKYGNIEGALRLSIAGAPIVLSFS